MIRAEVSQSLLRGGSRLPQVEVDRVLRVMSRMLKVHTPITLSIAFVSSSTMKQLNSQFRGKPRPTDVLSFVHEPAVISARNGGFLGEILLCYQIARRQAFRLDHSVRDELLFLIVHGVLHLFGHDHERAVDAKRMYTLQTRILTSLRIDTRL